MERKGLHKGKGMLFSIIVPAYNIECYIEECINSIRKQDYKEWELIIVDDGSDDNTSAICKLYEQIDKRIRYLYKINSGQSDARNLGIKEATGDYLLFVDGDDYIEQEALTKVSNSINSTGFPDVILSDGMSELHAISLKCEEHKSIEKSEYQGINGYMTLLKGIAHGLSWSPCGKAFRRGFWYKNDFAFPSGRISEDMTLIPQIILKAEKVACVDSFYVYRRFRSGSSVSDNVMKMVQDDITSIDDWERFFVKENVEEALISEFRKRFLEIYCHNTLAYLYIFSKTERQKLLNKIKSMSYLLKYARYGEEKVIRLSIKIIGYRATCYILGIIKRYRLSKIME